MMTQLIILSVSIFVSLFTMNYKIDNINDKISQILDNFEKINDKKNAKTNIEISNLTLELIRKEEIIKTKKNCNNFNEDALHRDVTNSYTHS